MSSRRLFQYFILLPIFSGVFLALTLPAFNLSFFLWIFLVPLLFFAGDKNRKKRWVFVGGFIAGLIYFFAVASPLASLNAWWWFDGNGAFNGSKEAISLIFVLLLSMSASIFYGLFALLYQKFRKYNLFDVLIFPFIWVVLEYIRAKILLGFTWGHIGYALHDSTWLLQLAKFFGVYGLGFFIITVNILIYLLIRKSCKGRSFADAFWKNVYLYLLIFLFIVVSFYGFWAIKSGEKDLLIESEMKVAVIQGGLKTKDEKTEGFYKKFIADALKQNPDIVVLPENTLWFLTINRKTKLPLKYEISDQIKKAYDEILQISKENKDVSFVIGFHTTQNNKEYNSMIVFENGEIKSMYDKRVLMPFSETGIFSSAATTPAGIFLNEGADKQSVLVKGVAVTPLICAEIIFPSLAKDKNSQFIINIGNDSVFDSPLVAKQNHIIAKIRAVESGKFIVRSMKTGISSIINPFGRVTAQLDTGESGTVFDVVRY